MGRNPAQLPLTRPHAQPSLCPARLVLSSATGDLGNFDAYRTAKRINAAAGNPQWARLTNRPSVQVAACMIARPDPIYDPIYGC